MTALDQVECVETAHVTKFPVAHEDAFWALASGAVVRIDPYRMVAEAWAELGGVGVPVSAHGYLWIPDETGTTVTIYD